MLRLGVNWSTIIQELQAGYGNVTKKTLAKRRDVFQKALGVALDKMDCRVVGGKKETVVMDEAIVGVHPEDGWSVGPTGSTKLVQNRLGSRRAWNGATWFPRVP